MSNYWKRLTAFFLVLVMALSLIPSVYAAEEDGTVPPEETTPEQVPQAMAEEEATDTPEGIPVDYFNVFLDDYIEFSGNGFWVKRNTIALYALRLRNQPGYADGYYVAYCVEPGIPYSNQTTHLGSTFPYEQFDGLESILANLTPAQIQAIAVILLYGEKQVVLESDSKEIALGKLQRQLVTQILIWEISVGMRSPLPPYTRSNDYLYNVICNKKDYSASYFERDYYWVRETEVVYDEIAAKVEQHYTIPSFASDELSFASTYTMNTGSDGRHTITLTDTNNILSAYTFTDTENVQYAVNGNQLTVTVSGDVSWPLTVAPTKPVPNITDQVFYVWQREEEQKMMSTYGEPADDPVPCYFKLTVQAGNLAIQKTTEDGKNLAGWQFGIYSDAACANLISGPHTTDSNGNLSVSGLTPQTVYVKELGHTDSAIQALYTCSSTNPQKVTVVAGQTATVSFYNKLNLGNVKLVKKTNTGNNLGGWRIGLYTDAACQNPVSGSPFTTGTDGTITVTGLKPGTFYAKELPSGDGYWVCDTAVKTVKVVANQTASATFTNTHYGRIAVQKHTNTGNHLDGWPFVIRNSNGEVVAELITDAQGYAVSGNLPLGRYTVQEIFTGDDYWQIELGFHNVTVKAGETVVDEWTNIEQGLGGFYKESNTGANEGWEITIYSDEACTQEYRTVITGESGKIGLYLNPGVYWAKETGDTQGRFNDGYWQTDTTVQRFEIKPHQDTSITFQNVQLGKLKIIKQMESEGSPAGWLFRVTDASGNEISGSPFTTSADGTILTGAVYPGTYTIEELIPEDSPYYCTSQNPKTVTVTAGQTAEVVFTNALRPGEISVQKVDVTGTPLAGAKFLLEWSEDGSSWNPIFYSDQVTKGGCSNPNVADGTLVTPQSGLITWSNLYPNLQYRVTELEAPEGFMLLQEPAFTGKLPKDNVKVSVQVVNSRIFTLPHTGSKSLVLMPVGLLLCLSVCAGAFLWLRKMEKHKK